MNRLVRPVAFAFEADVVSQFTKISFGAAGAPTLDTNNSKGVCNVARTAYTITGTTTNGSPTVTSVSSFVGLYKGMTVTGTNIPAATTISSMTPGSSTITLSANATGANAGLTVAGGAYTVTFGSQFTPFKRLDTYVKLLGISHVWDETGLQGGATTGASAPAATGLFIVNNSISIANNASVTVQFGSGAGTSFVASDPNSGDIVRIYFQLCRSTAI